MSFTAEVKDELSRFVLECKDCEKAMLAALVRIEGTLFISGPGKYRLEIATETGSVARTTIRLLHSVYDLKTELTVRRSVLHKTHNYLITVPTQIKLAAALEDLGVLSESGLELGISPKLVKKSCCAASYLRGAFLGGGFISDPRGDFHFELTTESEALAGDLAHLMQNYGIDARLTKRRNIYTVYLKGAERIVSFLALVNAYQSALAMENVRVVKSVRNDVNRTVNAEIANQAKATNAALSQVKAIKLLIKNRGIESIPPALQEFAMLRLSHPDVSLRELGELADPPLSKSAVYHRVRRIEELVADFLEDEKNR
ncbi:MAG: DNA-binding protein WhiA [Actinobacteria bacterium]|nr:DNA-binding protein WhiA [Actinomycetota bacterium]